MSAKAKASPSLGSCCVCGKTGPSVRNILQHSFQNPHGEEGCWACVICHVHGGAVSVLCDACLDAKAKPQFYCVGFPFLDKRAPISELIKPLEHRWGLHGMN